MVPAEDVYADQGEDPGQRWQDLFGDVVGRIQPQVGILQDFHGPPHQLYQGQPGHAVHNDVGHSLPDSRFRATVIGKHSPVQKRFYEFLVISFAGKLPHLIMLVALQTNEVSNYYKAQY